MFPWVAMRHGRFKAGWTGHEINGGNHSIPKLTARFTIDTIHAGFVDSDRGKAKCVPKTSKNGLPRSKTR
jgi:hypothetical protein